HRAQHDGQLGQRDVEPGVHAHPRRRDAAARLPGRLGVGRAGADDADPRAAGRLRERGSLARRDHLQRDGRLAQPRASDQRDPGGRSRTGEGAVRPLLQVHVAADGRAARDHPCGAVDWLGSLSHTTITFVVLAAVVVVFAWDRFPVATVALGTALALWATGVLSLDQSLAGFGEPTVLFIASLFVVSEGLESAGVTSWAGQELVARAGGSRSRLLVLMMLLVAFFTALISVNGAVAALVPVAVVISVRLGRSASQQLMPVAFAAHAGSMLLLTGTPVNVIVSQYAADAGVGRFGFFEFALVGIQLVAGTLAIVVLFGEHLLPMRNPRSIPADFSDHARTLVEQYTLANDQDLFTRRAGIAEVVIPPRSSAVGDTVFPGMVTDSGDLVVL